MLLHIILLFISQLHRPNYQTLFIYFFLLQDLYSYLKNYLFLSFISLPLALPRRHDPTIYQDFNIWGCEVNRCLNGACSYGVAVSNERGKATDRLALLYPRGSRTMGSKKESVSHGWFTTGRMETSTNVGRNEEGIRCYLGGPFDISTQSSYVENDPEIKVEARGNHACKEYASRVHPSARHAFTRLYLRVYIA